MEFQFAANHSHNYLHTHTLTHTHGSWISVCRGWKDHKRKVCTNVCVSQWASNQLMLQVDKRTWGLDNDTLHLTSQTCNSLICETKIYMTASKKVLFSSWNWTCQQITLRNCVGAYVCVIIWEELRGSCWEDICVRAWHLTLDLWMEFTHTHSFQLLRRDHCHCYAASVLIDTDWWDLKLCCSYAKDNLKRKGQYTCWEKL